MYFKHFSFHSGESATHYLVKNTVRTFKELGVSMCAFVCVYLGDVQSPPAEPPVFCLFFRS